MQSNNPVFRRSEEFNQSSPYGQTSYPGYAPSPQGMVANRAPRPRRLRIG